MQNKKFNLNSSPLPMGSYLVDTNVLLYMYEPNQVKNDPGYNDLLMPKTVNSSWEFFINSHIISEFINSFVRNSYNAYLKINGIIPDDRSYFKRIYRKTDSFESTYNIALNIVKEEILIQFKLTDELTTNSIKTSLTTDCGDFNDQLIINSALQNNLNIITNDRDYLATKAIHSDYPQIFSFQTFFK
ncbi:type II toxin-antitoxin system VapC family toxin [Latilactobacillus sakei]|uniref:type II toxin-antitoxin system VapC family toxin n=1 Tax=Latilactobacillus sakei TaxID=1599 RepID=UPI000976CDC8|nr:type II toxin-antitoxin system VapC family toxin [Latilactobacillus sakei]